MFPTFPLPEIIIALPSYEYLSIFLGCSSHVQNAYFPPLTSALALFFPVEILRNVSLTLLYSKE